MMLKNIMNIHIYVAVLIKIGRHLDWYTLNLSIKLKNLTDLHKRNDLEDEVKNVLVRN